MNTGSAFLVRLATPAEMPLVYELRNTIFTEEQGIPSVLDHDGLDDNSLHALAFSEQTKAVACGRLTIQKPAEAIIARIAVLKEYRGVNLGKKIIECLEYNALQHGVTKIELHPHKHLFKFYQSIGYIQEDKEERIIAGHTLLTMTKTF